MELSKVVKCVGMLCCLSTIGDSMLDVRAMETVARSENVTSNDANLGYCLEYTDELGVGYYPLDSKGDLLPRKASQQEVLDYISEQQYRNLPVSLDQFNNYMVDLLSLQTDKERKFMVHSSFHDVDINITFACINGNLNELDSLLDNLSNFIGWLNDYKLEGDQYVGYMPIKEAVAHSALSLGDFCWLLTTVETESLKRDELLIDHVRERVNEMHRIAQLPFLM